VGNFDFFLPKFNKFCQGSPILTRLFLNEAFSAAFKMAMFGFWEMETEVLGMPERAV
jgi:hypothetical protein